MTVNVKMEMPAKRLASDVIDESGVHMAVFLVCTDYLLLKRSFISAAFKQPPMSAYMLAWLINNYHFIKLLHDFILSYNRLSYSLRRPCNIL